MSRGLGQVQRGLLLALARLEVKVAEDAARHQLHYDPPNCLSVNQLVAQAARIELKMLVVPKLRAAYEEAVRDWGDLKWRRQFMGMGGKAPGEFDEWLERLQHDRYRLEMYLTPSRALALLRKRGLIRNDGGYYYQHVEQTYAGKYVMRSEFISRGQVMLTSTGLNEARRLGLPDSEIIDLDLLKERLQTAEKLSA